MIYLLAKKGQLNFIVTSSLLKNNKTNTYIK